MKLWNTNFFLNHTKGSMKSDKININCGIFQGDSLSPPLFCLPLIPLTNELNNTKYRCETYEKAINHLFYMDDLKLYAKNDKELEGLLSTVKKFSNIAMEFGSDKCAKATFIKGKLTRTTAAELDIDTTIRQLDQNKTYKYLGIDERNGIQHSKMKEKIRKECYRRARAILKTELNSANRIIEGINTLAMPVVQYSFNIINWTLQDLKELTRKSESC